MNRRTFLTSSVAAPAVLTSGCGSARPRLNVFNWSEYVAPDTISNFEREFGVEVRYAIYESAEEMLAKVIGGNSGWDVVFPSNSFLTPMRENNLLATLDHRQLPNLANLEPGFLAPEWDTQLTHSIPYMWGATGIAYRRDLGIRRWADLWDVRVKGRITMLDDPADTIGAALQKLRYPLNSTDPKQLYAARGAMLAQKPNVRAYLNSEARDQLVAGDLVASQMWTTIAQLALDDSSELAFVYPEEGFPLYCDNASILRESRRQELAHRFLNYLLRPQVSADIAAAVFASTPNAAAREILPSEIRDNPTLYPPPETLARGEWFGTLPPAAQRLRDRIWTQVKAA